MNDEAYIRKLARSSYWQQLYKASKKNSGIHLFNNINNFSGFQVLFLYWLEVYNMLYKELSNQDWKFLSERMIDDDTRVDAFLYYRSKEIEKIIRKNKLEEEKGKIKSKGKHSSNVTPFSIEMIRGN